MKRVYNFSDGPSMLPIEVMKQIEEDLYSYKGTGMSVMEISHRSDEFKKIIADARGTLQKLMHIPKNYKILFLAGDTFEQFAAIPMNLLSSHKCADYIISGQTSKNAYVEAKKYGDIIIAASSAAASPAFSTLPDVHSSDKFRPDADYVHMSYNNPIYGTKFNYIPDTGNIPLVADMTTHLLSEPIDVSKFGLIYAAGKANVGPSGITVVIVRDDLVGATLGDTPAILDYKLLSETDYDFNTPPIFSIYVSGLIFKWIEAAGGLDEMKRRNEKKASLIYDFLDKSNYYTSPVDISCRSLTNIRFVTGDAELDKKFIKEAEKKGLKNLAGHKSLGGMRASIYNAMPYEGVVQLIDFMKDFALKNPKYSFDD